MLKSYIPDYIVLLRVLSDILRHCDPRLDCELSFFLVEL